MMSSAGNQAAAATCATRVTGLTLLVDGGHFLAQ
jgi:hypothetical protein